MQIADTKFISQHFSFTNTLIWFCSLCPALILCYKIISVILLIFYICQYNEIICEIYGDGGMNI